MSDRIGVMSAGRLQQLGTPREIYTRPVNQFVAGFIGETNLLHGRVVPGGVRLDIGAVVPAETARSGAVTLTIRPEHVRLTPPEEAGAIPATLRDAVYFGTDTHYHLTLPDGVPLVARAQSGVDGVSAMTPGAAVGLRFIPGAAHVLED